MKPVIVATLLIQCLTLVRAQGTGPMFEGHALATLSPQYEVAAYRFQDLNADQSDELLVVGKQGQIQTWTGLSLKAIQMAWTLPFPAQSLLSLSSFTVNQETRYLITLTPEGLWAYPVNPDGSIDPAGLLINRRMKGLFRIGQPVFSNYLQDINQDGHMDILVPIMNYCEIWINRGLAGDISDPDQGKMPQFSKMGRFPVKMSHSRRTHLEKATGSLSEHYSVPSLLLKDVNGDSYLDLVVKHAPYYDYYLLDKTGVIPDKPTVSLDLTLFQDTTPKGKEVQFGETLNINSDPQLTESDLNHDQIPDHIIWHRRKLWFFHGTPQGPQFTNPTAIIKTAEDITWFSPLPLDEDDYPDLLMIKVQIPPVSRLLRGIFTDWEIKTESLGYQSKQGLSFELSSTWQGEIFLRLPSILSMISNMDEIMDLDIDQQYGPAVHGDFNGDAILDVAMRHIDNGEYAVWFGKEDASGMAPLDRNNPKDTAETIKKLLFTKTNNVWDIDRIKIALNTLVNNQMFAVTGGQDPECRLTQIKDRKDVKAVSVDINHDKQDELLFISPDPKAEHLSVFELFSIKGK